MSTGYGFADRKKKKQEKEILDKIAPLGNTAPVGGIVREAPEEGNWLTRWWDSTFQGGAFSDGYQFGDVVKTVSGTVIDLQENVGKAVVNVADNVVDAGAYAVGGIGGLFGADEFQDEVAKFIANDWAENEIAGRIAGDILGGGASLITEGYRALFHRDGDGNFWTDDVEKNSLLADGGRQMVRSLSDSAGYQGLKFIPFVGEMVSNAAMVVNGFGSEIESTYQQYVDPDTGEFNDPEGKAHMYALVNGAVSAAAEVITERMFGFSPGGKAWDTALDFVIQSKVPNKIVRGALKWLKDTAGEGVEEVVSGFITDAVKSQTTEKNIDKNTSDYLEARFQDFMGGALMGGVMGGGQVINSAVKGRDYTSGLTKNEEAVVNKILDQQIAEKQKENGGKKITNSEKMDMYEAIVKEMADGNLSVDALAEMYGGEDWQAYQEVLNTDNANLQKLAEVYEGEELKKQVADYLEHSTAEDAQFKAYQSAFDTVKNDAYLAESFKRFEKFDADLSKYDAGMQETIRKAVDKGLLNNTRATHKTVDFIAKLSSDKGVPIDLTTNEAIANSAFAVKGKTVDGYVNENGGITLNVESPKFIQSTVGHELTHILEGTELYPELQKIVTEYAKAKGEYADRYKAIKALYENVDGYKGAEGLAKIDKELVADLVGDYLFQDYDFVMHLKTESPKGFKKIWEEIKYLSKIAKAGSKEARQLEKVKKTFEEVYRSKTTKANAETKTEAAQKSTAKDGGVRLHISEGFSSEIDKVLDGSMPKSSQAKARDFTPDYLVENGARNLPMLMTQGHIKTVVYTEAEAKKLGLPVGKNINYHGLGKGLLLQAIDNMDNPSAVYRKDASNFIIITEMTDTDGATIIVPVRINGSGQYNGIFIDENHITSVYGKKNLQNYLENNNFEEIDIKKEGTALNEGVQYPNISNSLNNSIPKNSENVNTNSSTSEKVQKFSHVNIEAETAQKNTAKDGGVKLSLSETTDGRLVAVVDSDILKNIDTSKWDNETKEAAKKAASEALKQFKDGIVVDGITRKVNRKSRREYTRSKYTEALYNSDTVVFADKMRAAEVADDIVVATTDWKRDGGLKHERKDNFVDFDHGKTLIESDGNKYEAEVIVGITSEGEAVFYDVVDMVPATFDIKKSGSPTTATTQDAIGDIHGTSANDSIAKNSENVNTQPLTSEKVQKFSLSEPVEETKDLLAVHNLSSDKLLKSLELGGLPMPSVAIARAKDGHTEFGEISLILNKDAIDPKANKDNKVYGRDAWTPTYPTIEYKANDEVVSNISKKFYELEKKYGRDLADPLYNYAYDAENKIARAQGEQGLLEELKTDDSMMRVFLADTEGKTVPKVNKETVTELGEGTVEQYDYMLNKLGREVFDAFTPKDGASPFTQRRNAWEAHGESIKEAYRQYFAEVHQFSAEELDTVTQNMDMSAWMKEVLGIRKYLSNGSTTTRTETDIQASKQAVIDAVDGRAYEQWLRNMFGGIEEKSGIRNNRDMYTPSGNRRSWESLHWENTLENVVRVMKEGINGDTLFGGQGIWGVSAKEYNSIDEVKADSGRLTKMSEEEYNAMKDGFTQRLSALSEQIMDKNERNPFTALDTAAENIVDALRNSKKADDVYRYLRKYSKDATPQIAEEVVKLASDIANAPTDYFEAKPRRAVGFDEVAAFVIPRNADVKLKQELLNRGYNIAEYDPDVEGDRQKVVNQFEEYKFSLSDVGTTQKKYGDFATPANRLLYQEIAPVAEDIAPVRADIAEKNQYKSIVERLSNGEAVPIEEIENSPKIRQAIEESKKAEPTISIETPERQTLRQNIAEALINNGSYSGVDKDGKIVYNGNVRQDRRIDIVMGPPAAGKSSVLVNPLSQQYESRVIDSDMAKELLPEYSNGLGANAVHEESKDIIGAVLSESLNNGDNIVYPIVGGGDVQKLVEEIKYYKELDYSVYLYLNELNINKALGRALNRFSETGRFVPPKVVLGYGDMPTQNFNLITQMGGLVDGYSYYSNDVRRGETPNLIASKNTELRLLRRPRGFGKGTLAEDGSGEAPTRIATSQINTQKTEADPDIGPAFSLPENSDSTQKPIAPVAQKAPAVGETLTAHPIAPVAKKAEGTDDIAPVIEKPAPVAPPRVYEDIAPVKQVQVETEKAKAEVSEDKIAELLTEEPEAKRKKKGIWSLVKEYVLDNGMVFEKLAKKTNRRELEGRWNSIRYSDSKAQNFIKNGDKVNKSIATLKKEVSDKGLTKQLYEYMYHNLNVDRMSLESRVAPRMAELKGNMDDAQIAELAEERIQVKTDKERANLIRNAKEYVRLSQFKNKPVFGDSVTAEVSKQKVAELEKAHPELKQYAEEIYGNMKSLRQMLVDEGIVSEETAELWDSLYPHYVPIRRAGKDGPAINVPLDTNKTGINAPIKRATGGNSDILPLFDTMGQRAIQTYKAIAKNRFGVELKDALGSIVGETNATIDDAMDGVDNHEALLQKGENGNSPKFTVFEDGKRVTFEISEEMYDAMKPTSDLLSYTNKTLNAIGNFRRGTLTEYNALFLAKNAIKDAQDVLINSQHPARTYAQFPAVIQEMVTKGKWFTEYLENGGEQNTYFDSETNTFKEQGNGVWETVKKFSGLGAVQKANNVIEMMPRLAEYMASRKMGRSIDVSMLDSARVTTNFAAGGKLTKALNRNGFTFLNASVQGAVQQVRNFQEAKQNGLKGALGLAAKFAVAGLPVLLLNNLMWDDDEEYEELSDYVKQNYYIVGKFGDGKFVRIPKGRTVAVIQNAFEQMENLVTGDDEVDMKSFLDLMVSNLAPNNPLDNNVLSPIVQVAQNKTWYGEDLVPTRLQNLPAAEQYDETTDELSKWLGEKLNYSPYKINYLLDQYSGFVGDTFLPMMTPESESDAPALLAPAYDAFTTDSVLKNQNVSDFYTKKDELTVNANGRNATDEDILKSKYFNAINSELSELYAMKREIQNDTTLSDKEKYEAVREVQAQIVDLARTGLNSYEDVNVTGTYASVGGVQFRYYEPGEDSTAEPGWKKLTDDQIEKQEEVTAGLGISPEEYWSNKEEYDYAFEKPAKYAVAKAVGGYEQFRTYSSELYDIKADKDSEGKSITGSRKEKVLDYINDLDADYGEKIILFKSEYNADDTYNYEIIDYLNSRDDISYEEMEAILKELGFTVHSDGRVTW